MKSFPSKLWVHVAKLVHAELLDKLRRISSGVMIVRNQKRGVRSRVTPEYAHGTAE